MAEENEDIKFLKNGFDCVVMGTGLTETILSGVMSVEGKRVLHIDQNDYYGGEGASLKLSQLQSKFYGEDTPLKASLASQKDRDWNVDLIPKFLMAGGDLAEILRKLKQVQDNVKFQQINGSYVYRAKDGGSIYKVPATAGEAVKSALVGMMEKTRLKSFLEAVASYEPSKGPLWQGINVEKDTMSKVYDKFGLEPATRNFVGHAMALHLDDGYLVKPAGPTLERIRLYASSVAMYGKSPYIYPMYGLGDLPSAFTRLSAVYGGTYMLDIKVLDFEYNDGKVSGVKIEFKDTKKDGENVQVVVPTPRVLADPSYFPEGKKKKATGQKVIRAICLLKHSIKAVQGGLISNSAVDIGDSAQIIIPQSEVGRKHDIYIAIVSHIHEVCPQGYWLAIVSTIVETDNPQHELKPAFDLLDPIEEKFMGKPVVLYEQADDASDNIFLSKSFDATSHFETCTDDVKDLYKRMEGKDLDIQGLATASASE